MSALRISSLAVFFTLLAIAAAAQTPIAPDQPQSMPGMVAGGAMQPVMDQSIFAHLIFNELESRFGVKFSEDDLLSPSIMTISGISGLVIEKLKG